MLNSLVSYPVEPSVLYNTVNVKPNTQRLATKAELYKLTCHLEGSIVKCGVSSAECFSFFSFFNQVANHKKSLVSFEKNATVFGTIEVGNELFTVVNAPKPCQPIDLMKMAQQQHVDFLPGDLSDSIPNYLMENPEIKIALLAINLDDYESALTALQYLYPRLVEGGVLVLDNYHKKEGQAAAIGEYFCNREVFLRYFSQEKGPYYIIKD